MENNRDWSQLGNEMRRAVESSVRTGDFTDLRHIVSDTVNDAVSEARRQVALAKEKEKEKEQEYAQYKHYDYRTEMKARRKKLQNGQRTYQYTYVNRTYSNQPDYERAQNSWSPDRSKAYNKPTNSKMRQKLQLPAVKLKRKGDVSGVLLTIFGSIEAASTGLVTVILGVTSLLLMKPLISVFGGTALLAAFGVGVGMIGKGSANRKRVRRAERYLSLCKGKSYVNLIELAKQTGKSEGYVRRDLKKMVRRGIFPEGHFDSQESCFILTDDTYREYLQIEKQRSVLEIEELAKEKQEGKKDTPVEDPKTSDTATTDEKARWRQKSGIPDPDSATEKDNPTLAAMIRQGQECTGHIRELNDVILGEVISAKLSALESILKEIFVRVMEHPEQMNKMKKFMDYYLPTTVKLVEAYEEFDSVADPGEEIVEAKSEIEKTLDTINQSFVELRNQMFTDAAFDATTDAKVLQTMLAKDGLARDHAFEKSE